MAFFRKLFRGNQTAPLSDEAPEPAAAPEPGGAPEELPQAQSDAPAAADETLWWDESVPADAPAAAPTLPAIGATAPLAPSDDLAPHPMGGAEGPLAASRAPLGTRDLSPATGPLPTPPRAHSRQGLAAAALRDIGRVRAINQDSVFSLLSALPRESADIPLGLFVVADGMGGHEGGEIASRLAVASVAQHVLGQLVLPALNDDFGAALQPLMVEAVELANRTIWQQGQELGSDMGTTCTAVLLLGSAVYIAHVGDSRAYVLEPDGLRQLTSDHSAVGRLIQLGQLDPSEAREHPLRNQLYRTVGQHPQVLVDFVYHPLGAASHLLLGSDGLWGLVHEAQMASALRGATWPLDACRTLVAHANDAGGEDNISALVVALPVAETEPA
ncbi:MAG: serine/threonine-protein phosphatase [Chloroflexales bacterium]|nr:serine/threonine-protein phosphatase [Chloroflexales bacterium]